MLSALYARLSQPFKFLGSSDRTSAVPPDGAAPSHNVTAGPTKLGEISPRPFSYVPLEDTKNGFRLVILDPAKDSEAVICCRLLNASLESAGEYEALSYCWGREMAGSPVLLRYVSESANELPTTAEAESFEFTITRNLEAALRAMRLPQSPRTLWIDSICIDQKNTTERNVQVSLMGRIYRQCRRDLLWLGVETDKIRRAMNLVQKLATCNKNDSLLSEFQERDWSDIEAMIGANPVWRRVWIVQEIYCAPEILLFCHGQSLDWDVVVNMIEDNAEFKNAWVNQSNIEICEKVHRSFYNISTFHAIRHEKCSRHGLFVKTLLSVVLTFGTWEATEPVDRIYGLLNIVEDTETLSIDYKKSLDEVSIDFARHTIIHEKSLLILSAALSNPQDPPLPITELSIRTLPSWTIDLTKPISSGPGLTQNGQALYNACGLMSTPIVQFSPTNRALAAAGWFIDKVHILHTVSPQLPSEPPRQRWLRDVHRWAPDNTTQEYYTPTNESLLSAFLRTVRADRKNDKRLTAQDLEGWRECEELDDRHVPEESLMLRGWRFGTGESGIYCMFPPTAQEGDVIVVLFGAKVPYLLSPALGEGYRLVGEAYLHGFMDGEVMLHVAEGVRDGKPDPPSVFEIF